MIVCSLSIGLIHQYNLSTKLDDNVALLIGYFLETLSDMEGLLLHQNNETHIIGNESATKTKK